MNCTCRVKSPLSRFVLLIMVVTIGVIQAAPIADGSSKFLGNITGGAPPANYADYWNQITLENGGKWGSVQGSNQNTFNWQQTDAAYKFCKDKGWPFKHHCFVWGQQQPNWVNSGNARAAVENYIKTFGERYPDVELIDVVNEPLHAPAGYRDGLGGNGTTGWDWVITVFELARKYCPKSKLILNDYGIVNDANATKKFLEIIRALQKKDLIDMIGVQSHYFNLENTTPATIKKNLDSLANTGLPITSSEFDLTGDQNTQLQRYKTYFPIFWEHPAVVGVTLWGYLNNWGGAIIMSGSTEYSALKWLRTYVDSIEILHPIVPIATAQPAVVAQAVSPVKIAATQGRNIRITLPLAENVTISILDPYGKTVFKTRSHAAMIEHTIDLSTAGVCRGVYVVMVKGRAMQASQKILW